MKLKRTLIVSSFAIAFALLPALARAESAYNTYSYGNYYDPYYSGTYYPQYPVYVQPAYTTQGTGMYAQPYYPNNYYQQQYYPQYRYPTVRYRFPASDYQSYDEYYYDNYYRSYHYDTDVYQRTTDSRDALPSYYKNYTTPPARSTTSRTRYTAAPTPKYYPPATIVPLFKDKIYPASLTVQQGTMVTWVNADEDGLYVIEGDDFDFISPALGPDQEASYSFDRIGTFKYHDRLHPWTKGTVRVTH